MARAATLLLLGLLMVFPGAAPARSDSFPGGTIFVPQACGAPLPPGKVLELKDAKGFLIGRIRGDAQNRNTYTNRMGQRQGWVVFKGDRCEVFDRTGRITYRGRWK